MRYRLAVLGAGLLCAAMVTFPGVLRAQDGPEGMGRGEGRGQFAGGQMVRGTVTAIANDHLTIKTDADEVYQVALSANTRINKDRQPVKVTDIKIGDNVGAGGVLDAPTKTVHALFIAVVDAEQVKKLRENLGKTYIAGKVTAIDVDALKLTVLRSDHVSQVIAVDEGTSFRRGGRMMISMMNGSGPVDGAGEGRGAGSGAGSGEESITLADIKVGDMVGGPGALKNGVFVPTQLGVVDPSQRRRRPEEGNALSGTGTTAPKVQTTPVPAPK
jgi:hypothetical protein